MGGSDTDFGFILAVYSHSRMLVTIPLDYISNTMSRAPFLVTAFYTQYFAYLRHAIAPDLTILYF